MNIEKMIKRFVILEGERNSTSKLNDEDFNKWSLELSDLSNKLMNAGIEWIINNGKMEFFDLNGLEKVKIEIK